MSRPISIVPILIGCCFLIFFIGIMVFIAIGQDEKKNLDVANNQTASEKLTISTIKMTSKQTCYVIKSGKTLDFLDLNKGREVVALYADNLGTHDIVVLQETGK